MEQYLSILKKLKLFDGITNDEIAQLCRTLGCYTAHYEKGALLWCRGDRVSTAGIVLSGCIRAEQNTAEGLRRIITQHGEGALFGDVLMSSQMQRSPVDIVACENTEVLFLPLESIMRNFGGEIEAAQVRFRLNLLGEISDKYWVLYRRISCLTASGMRSRIARYLLDLCEEQKKDTLHFTCTREAMAAQLSVNRSALCRELGRMQREGIILISRKECTLCNISQLKRIAER